MDLTTIPRASTIKATDAFIGSNSSIAITKYYSAFTHSIKYTFGNLSGYILADGSVTSTETKISATTILFTVPTSFYAQIPNKSFGTCTLTIKTYNGNSLIGSAQTSTFKVTVDKDTNSPTVSGSSVIDVNQAVINVTGSNSTLVKYMSTARVTPSATAKNSATISQITVNNQIVSGNYKDISNIDVNSITIKATDSRGYEGTEILNSTNQNFTWVDYLIPTFGASTEFKRLSPTSDTVKVNYSGNYYKGNIGNSVNALTITWKARRKGATTWEGSDVIASGTLTPTIGTTTGRNTFSGESNLTGTFSYQEEFEFRLIANDLLSNIAYEMSVGMGIPYYDYGKDNNGNTYFNVNGTIYQNNEKVKEEDLITESESLSKNISTGSWQKIMTTDISKSLKKGKYIVVVSCAITGNASGIATVRPLINNAEINSSVRNTIPLVSGLLSSTQIVIIYDCENDGAVTFNGEIYSNAACTASAFKIDAIRISN